eukprot:Phypoly_transcript_00215.p1 GENE.Phypoly_transcript_00215~~Phypoly_transcript_00215.p1  ORF type:complete len:1942 (+),score=349.45 Phypoly_transcript_00215:90-5915(+)
MSVPAPKVLDEKLAALQKAVQEGKGGTNAQKYDVLWNLDKLIASANKNEVAESGIQTKFFQLLVSAVNQGCSPSVARVIGLTISKFVDVTGDTKLLINLLKSIHTTITNKSASPTIKNTAMEVVGLILEKKGLATASLFVDTANILIKQIKANEAGTKPSALKSLRAAMVGAGSSASSMYEEILKTSKSCGGDKLPEVRIAALRCVNGVAKQCTWPDILEKIVSFSVKLLEDEVAGVRLEAAVCLGLTLVQTQLAKQMPGNIGHSQGAKSAISVVGSAPLRKLPSTWDVDGILHFLGELFIKATKKEHKASISHAFVRFLCESKPQTIEKNTEVIVNNVMRLVIPSSKLLGTQIVDLQGLACIRYIFRDGLSEKLSETGQQNMIKLLCKHLTPAGEEEKIELVQVAAMREISAQLLELGEGGLSMGESLTAAIVSQLNDRSPAVRLTAASCLRAISTALPKYTATLLSQCLRNIRVIHADFDPSQPDSLRGSLSPLKGNAHAAAALIISIRSSELGVPVSLLNYVMQTASLLFSNLDNSTPASAVMVLVETGWALIDALVSTMGPAFMEPLMPSVLAFLKTTFSIGGTGTQVVSEREISIFCRTRADALSAIFALASYCPALLTQKILQQIMPYLASTLNTVLNLPANTSNLQPNTVEVIRLLELNLLKSYYALPPSSYSASIANLLRVVVALMLDGPATSLLRHVLHSDDAPLGPWEQGDEGKLEQLCEPLFLPHLDASVVWTRDSNLAFSNQQPTDVRVVDAAIQVYVLTFVSNNEKHRLNLFKHLDTSINDTSNSNQRLIRKTNSLCAMLLVSKMMTERRLSFGKGDSLSLIQKFIQKFIGEPNVSAALRRSAGEALGYLCNAEGDAFTANLVRNITELVKKPSKDVNPTARAGAAFVLACIQRSVGGMMAQRHVPATVGSLHVLAQDASPQVATWAMHSLTISVNEAGLSFSSFATPTLMLVSTLLQNDSFLSTTSAYQVLGQLVNAIIGALGPELKPGSPTMLRCEAVCAEMENHPNPLVRLEAIYFKQKLVLFAPHTADLVSFLPSMVAQFSSPFLSLRSAAVTCLKQLVQASKEAAGRACQLGEMLFLMLDRERDAALRAELQLLLSSLLDMAAPKAPLPWLTLCKGVVLSASSQADAGPTSTGPQEEDEEVQSAVGPPAASEQEYVYRWYTKVFAMECVRRVMSVLKGQQVHFDLVLARQSTQQDYLVIHLHDLVTMAFKAATSETDSLRPVGVWTLKDIVENFANAADPEYEGHSLLELYQAQIASALRPAFAADALPTLTAVACSVLVSYISTSSSLEISAVRKLLTLLTAPLVELREMSYPSYNEKTITVVQVGILTALAQLHNASVSPTSPENHQKFAPLLAPSLHLLRVHWMAFLRDFAFLSATPAVPANFYKATFHNHSIKSEVAEYYHSSFPTILQAASSLVSGESWFDGRETDVPEQPQHKAATGNPSASPNNSVYTPEVKEMLKETKGIQDWFVMYGLTLKLLTMVNVAGRVALALRVFKYLMNNIYLRFSLFGLEALKEFLQVLSKLAEADDMAIKTEVGSLLLLMIDGFEANYFSSSMAESPFQHILALVMSPLHKFLHIGSNDKNPAKAQPQVLPLLVTSLTTISRVSRLLVPHLRATYGPILLYVTLQTIELAHTQGDTLFPVALQALTGVAKAEEDTPEWEHTVFSAVSVLLRSVTSKLHPELPSDIDRNEKNINNLIVALMSLVMSLQAKPQHHHPDDFVALHQEVVSVLRTAFATNNPKLKHLSIQLTRTMVQTAATTPNAPSYAFSFLQAIAPHVAIQVYKSKGVAIGAEDEQFLSDQVKFLAIAHNLAPENQKTQVLRVLLPCLLRMLQPNAQPPPAIHGISLQLINHLASTVPQDFKEVVGGVPPEEKQALETSVRQTVATANAAAAKTPSQPSSTTTAPKTSSLTFDFSKYKK